MSSKLKLRKLRFHKSAKPTAQEKLSKAIEEHKRGKVDAAVMIYRQILTDDPEQVDALNFLGVAEHQLGHSEAALEFLGRALDLMPDHPDARNNRGNVFKQIGRLDEAEKDYRRVIALRPTDAGALNNLGTVLRQRNDLEAAATTFRQAIALSPKQAAAWQNLGNVLGNLTRYDEALDAHREAMRLAPQSADCYRNLGAMLYSVGRAAEAAEVYQQWLDRFPNDPRARHFVASYTGENVPRRAPDDYVRAEFEGFAASFDEVLARLEYRAPQLVTDEVARLAGEPRADLQVLDAGCGTGLCGPLLRPWAARLAGVDLSPAMVDLARKRSGYDALVVDELTAYLASRPASFHLIVSADTLVYFGDLGEVSRAAAKALRPGGALIFTVEAAVPGSAPDGFRINPHGRYSHTREYLLRVLAEAGFATPAITDVSLRKEATRWVEGYLIGAVIHTAPVP